MSWALRLDDVPKGEVRKLLAAAAAEHPEAAEGVDAWAGEVAEMLAVLVPGDRVNVKVAGQVSRNADEGTAASVTVDAHPPESDPVP